MEKLVLVAVLVTINWFKCSLVLDGSIVFRKSTNLSIDGYQV